MKSMSKQDVLIMITCVSKYLLSPEIMLSKLAAFVLYRPMGSSVYLDLFEHISLTGFNNGDQWEIYSEA